MPSNLALIRSTYEGPSEENGKHLLEVLAPDAVWVEAPGFPYAGTYVGAEAIIANVFRQLATEWIDYTAKVHSYIEDGDRVAAFGVYSGIYAATGKPMQAIFAHLYQLKDGQIIHMTQYVDSSMVQQAMRP